MRAREFLNLTEEKLNELNMSPGFLQKAAKSLEGAYAGIEFEMIVAGIGGTEDNNAEYEPNYDLDRKIDVNDLFTDIKYFFSGSEDLDQAMSEINDRTIDNKLQEFFDDFNGNFGDYLSEKDFASWFKEQWWNDIEESLVNEFRAMEEYEDLPDDEVYKEAFEEFERMVSHEIRREGKTYQEYYDRFNDEMFQDYANDTNEIRKFMRANDCDTMSGFSTRYELDWPYYINANEADAEQDLEMLGMSFSKAIGRKVRTSTKYHAGERNTTDYVIEPDSSLEPDFSHSDTETGLEFISPPLPIDEMVKDLRTIVAWAKDNDCYTNKSTGLHMNVSIPNMSTENLDYIKLALFLGDEYILDQFGRLTNVYCKSAITKIKMNAEKRPDLVAQAMDMMRSKLNSMAGKLIHDNVTDKYTSINTKSRYVEIRSPGGDWLNEDLSKLISTLYRTLVALDAACDKEKYKEEYAKKFYKLLSAQSNDSAIQLFTQYNNGQITRDELKALWADKVVHNPNKGKSEKVLPLANKILKGSTSKSWWKVGFKNPTSGTITRTNDVVAMTPDEAIMLTRTAWNLPAAKYGNEFFKVERTGTFSPSQIVKT